MLVWFHGGGFTSGSGGWDWYNGRNLAETGEIVVVTADYRIGPLGYPYLPEHDIENLGVQDQSTHLTFITRAAFAELWRCELRVFCWLVADLRTSLDSSAVAIR